MTIGLIKLLLKKKFPVLSPAIFFVVPSDKTMCPEASENEYQEFLLG
jgi:hypothetical protein